MWTPVFAAVWESWRLTRWQLVLVPAFATFCGVLLARNAVGILAYVIILAASVAMALALPSFGKCPGFPLSKAFARPIRTAVLVAAPLTYLFLAAAACYLVPALVVWVTTGAALPLMPAATAVGALAVLVAGSSWATRNATARTGLAVAALVLAGVMIRTLDPFREAGGAFSAKVASRHLFVLSGRGYLTVLVFVALTYLWIWVTVTRQRHGEDNLAASDATSKPSPKDRGDILETIRDTCVRVLRWHCPVSSPAAAEIWFELQSYGIPVLVIGTVLALCIPALISWGNAVHSLIPVVIAACTLAAPFLVGVGSSIWNRRNSSGANLSAFEAARSIGTAELIGLRVLVTSACIFATWLLMAASLWLSLPLLTGLHLPGTPAERALDLIHRYGVRLLSGAVAAFILLATLLGILAALRALASSYGLRLWIAALCLVIYIAGVTVAFAQGAIGGMAIDANLYALAIAISTGTILVARGVLTAGILGRRQLALAVLPWGLFSALYLDLLRASGAMDTSPALVTLALSASLLPLLAMGAAPWALSLIRHG